MFLNKYRCNKEESSRSSVNCISVLAAFQLLATITESHIDNRVVVYNSALDRFFCRFTNFDAENDHFIFSIRTICKRAVWGRNQYVRWHLLQLPSITYHVQMKLPMTLSSNPPNKSREKCERWAFDVHSLHLDVSHSQLSSIPQINRHWIGAGWLKPKAALSLSYWIPDRAAAFCSARRHVPPSNWYPNEKRRRRQSLRQRRARSSSILAD